MVVVLLVARIGSVSHERFVEPIQCYLSQTAHVAADDSRPGVILFKTRTAAGAEAPCSFNTPLIPELDRPIVDEIVPLPVISRLPEVYREIFIPPECRLVPVCPPVSA